ncbi:MAG: IS200/IS605 family transposase [Leptolyngbyaceae cyanobacterium]|uniref:IS200/IS605 family transposase n=1 Tax=Leptodesmis sichuanensis TaxID=2906798 RepID=UPI001F2BE266|nr:IS200/IS605 family transposase [Leptodesmis sichuanensis]UIE39257.1 IS200/IS605 family transposase [Leptodesmis sichuanensis A121]
MRDNYTQLYIHCVWATWDRLSIITPDIQSAIYAEIIRQCQQLKSTPIVVGGVADHVHLLAGIPPTLSISELMKAVKGSSSHFVTHVIRPGEFFKWQGSYGAFSVSPDHLDRIANYIRNQPQHHAQDILTPHWELPPPVRAGGH